MRRNGIGCGRGCVKSKSINAMNSRHILNTGLNLIDADARLDTPWNIMNVGLACRMKWEVEEMGGIEHVQFAHRNRTPIVPPGHCGHPIELLKRGFIDGKGWPEKTGPDIKLFKWPDGNHWYAYVNGKEVIENGRQKWNTAKQAEEAANRVFLKWTAGQD